MEAIDAILSRRSIRKYTDEPITESEETLLLKAAMSAPNTVNNRDWAFVIIREPQQLCNLADCLKPNAEPLRKAQMAIVVCGDLSLTLQGIRVFSQHRVSEFGAIYSADQVELPDRLLALDEQMSVFDKYAAHWSLWTYKDLGIMGVVNVRPDSGYMRVIQPVFSVKKELHADNWSHFLPPTQAVQLVNQLADLVEEEIDYPVADSVANHRYMAQHLLSNYVAPLLQPVFARQFQGMSETKLDEVLQSFRIQQCQVNQPLLNVLKKHLSVVSL